MQLSDYKPAGLWLDQFNRQMGDRKLAEQMLDKFRYVSNVDLASDIAILLEKNIPRLEKAALYVEREMPTTRSKKPMKMYREDKVLRSGSRKKAFRATGAARAVVRSPTNRQQQVGSEGVIAQQLTQLCAKSRRRFLLHPSAEEIRAVGVRHIVIVTDFVGSGTRVHRMLESLWQVRSVRSWRSGKFVRMWVMSYSGTEMGLSHVQKHRSRPNVRHVLPCPTLDNSFGDHDSAALKDLCRLYGQFHARPLGYGEVGALIAFEHSCPNNVPAVFIESSASHKAPWEPMFEKRSTTQLAQAINRAPAQIGNLALETLGYLTIANAQAYISASHKKRNIILLLAAFARRHRDTCELVGITRMPLWELSLALSQATELGLVDAQRRLSVSGRKELRKLELQGEAQLVAQPQKSYYHPTVLRVPC